MKLTISHDDLSRALGVAARAVGKNPNVPAVGTVLFEATPDDALICTGTDLRLRAWQFGEAPVEAAGAVCLDPKAISDFLDAVRPEDPIAISVDGGYKATLISGRTTARIAGLDPEQFPSLAMGESAREVSLPPDLLRTLVDSTAFAALAGEGRPALTGVDLDCDGATLTLTAADGLRLARRSAELMLGDGLHVNVPARALAVVASGLKDASGMAHLSLDEQGRTLGVRSSAGCWAIQLLEDPFPDVSRMLTQAAEQTVVVGRDDLLRACRLIGRMTADILGADGKTATRVSKAILEISNDSVTIRAGDSQADHEATAIIDAAVEGVSEQDEPLLVALNTAALRDAAEALAGPLAIELCGPGRSVILRSAHGSRVEQVHVIQPMAIPNLSQRR